MSYHAKLVSGKYPRIDVEPTLAEGAVLHGVEAPVILDEDSAPSLLPFMGGKAANLYRLTNNGVPVPAWVCVSSRVCDAALAMQQGSVERHLGAIDYDNPESILQASDAIRSLIMRTSIPGAVRRDLAYKLNGMGALRYAVRSSGLLEDSTSNSCAGQFDTFLYVNRADVFDRIKQCWASAYTARNLAYLHRLGVTAPKRSVAVVIQVMIDSEAAGVMFTANPTGSADEIVVVSGYGLGEGIVSDQVETDTCIYDRTRRTWCCDIQDKIKSVRLDVAQGSGTTLVKVEESKRHKSALNDEQLEQLMQSGEFISSLYGDHQDIEWAFNDAGELFITQSRPITTIPTGRQTVFDNSNVVESYPGITSPLTVSHIQHAYENLFRNAVLRLGVSRKLIRRKDFVFKNMLGYLGGRIYYNLTNWYQMFRMVPAVEPYLPVWEEMLGITRNADQLQQSWLKRLPQVPRMVWIAARIVWHFLFLKPYMKSCARSFRRIERNFRTCDIPEMGSHELAELHDRLNAEVLVGWEITLINDIYAFVFTAISRQQLKKFGLDENVFGGLMAGDDRLESAAPIRSMVRMAEMVRRDTGLTRQLNYALSMSAEEFNARPIDALFGKQEFVNCLQHHLDEFGDRCVEELKLESNCFRDDPQSLLRLISSYAASEISLQQMEKHRVEIRESATNAFRSTLRGHPFRRLLVNINLSLARRSIRYRESSRLDRARAFGLVRSVFRSLGQNLAREGSLQVADDVFFLTVDEVLGFVTGISANEKLQGLVEERKADRERHESFGPAERIRTQGTVRANVVPPKARAAAVNKNGMLNGTGCSAGLAKAEAVLVRSPADAGDVHGKILVAEMTDPGWVFLMVSAAGLVVEKGSLLSHTAIIGRELGVPTVVGVAGATELIRDGQVIQVNGQTGEIVLQEGQSK